MPMKMPEPNPTLMVKYCDDILPSMLADGCAVEADLASEIAADVMQRAEALATLSGRAQDIVIAPFVEEMFDHKPLGAGLDLKAKVTVVVRNSALERAHHDGLWPPESKRSQRSPQARCRTSSLPAAASPSTIKGRIRSSDWKSATPERGHASTP